MTHSLAIALKQLNHKLIEKRMVVLKPMAVIQGKGHDKDQYVRVRQDILR